MKRLTLLAAVVLFVAAFFMPAYAGDGAPYSGWKCFRFCASVLGNPQVRSVGAKCYYLAFVVTNFLFLFVATRAVVSRKRSLAQCILACVLLAHVISWWLLNLSDRMQHSPFPLYFGYFVWLAAFVCLVVSTLIAPRLDEGPNQPSQPMPLTRHG